MGSTASDSTEEGRQQETLHRLQDAELNDHHGRLSNAPKSWTSWAKLNSLPLQIWQGYWQVSVAREDCIHHTLWPLPVYDHAIRIVGCSSHLPEADDVVIKGLSEFAKAYLDDLVIFSNS